MFFFMLKVVAQLTSFVCILSVNAWTILNCLYMPSVWSMCMSCCFANCCLLCLIIFAQSASVSIHLLRLLTCCGCLQWWPACSSVDCLHCLVPTDLTRNVKQSKSMRHSRKHGQYAASIVVIVQQIDDILIISPLLCLCFEASYLLMTFSYWWG